MNLLLKNRKTFQIPDSELLIWTFKKEGKFISIICNQREVYKYDYDGHGCKPFTPKIKFSNLDTASIMYKVMQEKGKSCDVLSFSQYL